MGSVCHGYMSILLYVKLLQCIGFQRSVLNWGVKFMVNLSCTLHLNIILHLTTRCHSLGVNLKVTLAVNSASKLEGALLLGTRCHCMNTSSENMKSFQVCPLDVTHLRGKLEGDSGSKLEGDSGSKLEGALLLVTVGGKLEPYTSSENMNSFRVLLLLHRGLFYERPIRGSF